MGPRPFMGPKALAYSKVQALDPEDWTPGPRVPQACGGPILIRLERTNSLAHTEPFLYPFFSADYQQQGLQMAFLEKVKPVNVPITGSRLTPEEKCRVKMMALIRKQSSSKQVKRSWFITAGDQEVFAPRYANVNLVQRMTRGKQNAFPLYKTRNMTLKLFTKDVQDGKLDPIMLKIAQERSKQLTGKRRKK